MYQVLALLVGLSFFLIQVIANPFVFVVDVWAPSYVSLSLSVTSSQLLSFVFSPVHLTISASTAAEIHLTIHRDSGCETIS